MFIPVVILLFLAHYTYIHGQEKLLLQSATDRIAFQDYVSIRKIYSDKDVIRSLQESLKKCGN